MISFVYFFFFSSIGYVFPDTLEKVAIIVRHGDRAPYAPWTAIDPINNRSEWPEGWGKLTVTGKQRMYSLGKFIGQRYSNLVSHPDEVVVHSSSSVRCMMSVECLLAGAFPPNKDDEIAPGLQWQPIAVKVNASMLYNHAPCPAFTAERERLRSYGEEAIFNQENSNLYDFVTEKSGRQEKSSFAAYALFDRLMLAESRGLGLPSWATSQVMQRLKEVAIADFYFNQQTLKQRRLRTGLLFKDIVDRFSKSSKKHKMFIYSTHDVEISIILQVMEAFNMKLVHFGASVYIELHKLSSSNNQSSDDSEDNHYIKIFYLQDNIERSFQEIIFPGCRTLRKCWFSRFVLELQPYFVNDFDRECREV